MAVLAAPLILSPALPAVVPAKALPGDPVVADLRLAAAVPGKLAEWAAAAGEPRSANRANAPADKPEQADTLPARGLRPDFARRGGEAAAGETAAGESAADEAGASAPGESSRDTPGMSQPGSPIARLPPPGQLPYLNRSHVRLYRPPVTFLEPLLGSAATHFLRTPGGPGPKSDQSADWRRQIRANSRLASLPTLYGGS